MKKSKSKIIFLAVLFLGNFVVAKNSWAAEYYVSPTGSDTDIGTEFQPWKTIQKAADVANAGDIVTALPGEYDEQVKLNKSGTLDQRISFRGSARQARVLHGFHTNSQSYINIEDFSITNNTGGWNAGGIFLTNSSYINIQNNYFSDLAGEAINSWKGTSNNINVLNNKMYRVNFGINAGGENWLVEGNDIERLYRFSVFNPDMYGTDADYARFSGENIIFRRNYFHGTLSSEVGTSHTDGFQTFSQSADTLIRNVTIEGNIVQSFSQGIMIDQMGESTGLDFENILVHNNIFASGNTGIGEKQGSLGVRAYGVFNLQVINNVFIGIVSTVASCKNSKTDGTGSICVFLNNIFLNNGDNYGVDSGSELEASHNMIWPSNTLGSDTDVIGDPLVLNSDSIGLIGSDRIPFTSDDGYKLRNGSPAINAGSDASAYGCIKDIFDTSRPQGTAWDIGAYEYEDSGKRPSSPVGLSVR